MGKTKVPRIKASEIRPGMFVKLGRDWRYVEGVAAERGDCTLLTLRYASGVGSQRVVRNDDAVITTATADEVPDAFTPEGLAEQLHSAEVFAAREAARVQSIRDLIGVLG